VPVCVGKLRLSLQSVRLASGDRSRQTDQGDGLRLRFLAAPVVPGRGLDIRMTGQLLDGGNVGADG
jgi:hypothetical protein